jgi:hypothetical protein
MPLFRYLTCMLPETAQLPPGLVWNNLGQMILATSRHSDRRDFGGARPRFEVTGPYLQTYAETYVQFTRLVLAITRGIQ